MGFHPADAEVPQRMVVEDLEVCGGGAGPAEFGDKSDGSRKVARRMAAEERCVRYGI
jgi:hypothetical protein